MTARIRRTRFLPNTFATLTRAFVLVVLVGLSGASAAHAHETEAVSSVAASEIASVHECCHPVDQAAQHADCALSMCCSLSALVGNAGYDMPPASASLRLLIGPMGFASRSHPPVLHPPIAM